MNRRTKAAALLLAVLCVTACGTADSSVADRIPPTGQAPLPAGAGEVTALPEASADTSCDPTASLRPSGPPPAPGNFLPGSTMAKIRAQGKLIAGVDQNTYQFGFRDPETGEIKGFDLDMVREIAFAIFGDRNAVQLRVLTSSQRIDALTSGSVNIVVQTMTINCERRKDVDFSSVYYEAGQKVLVKSGSGYTGIESLGGKKVCASKGSTSLANIVNADVEPKPIGVEVPGWTDCLVMLQQNQVEAVSTDDTILAGLRAQDPLTELVGQKFTSEPYGMAMPKGQDDFVRFVNAVLERMRADGTWTRIYNKWLLELVPGGTPAPPTARYKD